MTEIVLSPVEQEKIEQAAAEVPAIVAAAHEMVVTTPEQATAATEFLSRIAAKKRADETVRKALVGPLNAHVKFINDQAQEQAREERERAEAAAAAEQAVQSAPQTQVAATAPLRSDSGSIAVRKRWDFEVTNPEQVPRHYLAVDEKAIRAAVRAGEREIPGVSIFQVDDLAVRAR